MSCDTSFCNKLSASVPLIWIRLRFGKAKIASLLVEGGAAVFSEFLKQRLVDDIVVLIAPKILGEGLNALNGVGIKGLSDTIKLQNMKHRLIGQDLLIQGRPLFKM